MNLGIASKIVEKKAPAGWIRLTRISGVWSCDDHSHDEGTIEVARSLCNASVYLLRDHMNCLIVTHTTLVAFAGDIRITIHSPFLDSDHGATVVKFLRVTAMPLGKIVKEYYNDANLPF